MRQVQFSRTGPAEVMSLGDAPMPEPAAGQVRLRVVAAGINRADVAHKPEGTMPDTTKKETAAPADQARGVRSWMTRPQAGRLARAKTK